LGLLPNVIIDQHFAERGRIGRLIGAVSQSPRLLGIGLDEDTAVVVTDSHMRVIGAGAVYVVDGSGETHSNIAEGRPDRGLAVYDLRRHVLSDGDEFDIATRRPRRAASPHAAAREAADATIAAAASA